MMNAFKKRIFTPIETFKTAIRFIKYLPVILKVLVRPSISRGLREEIVLAVTLVNDCRYCAWGHTHIAIHNGVDMDELHHLLQTGKSSKLSDKDATAILFAQHYADVKGKIEENTKDKLNEFFTPWQVLEIMVSIYSILLGNCFGNIVDAFYHRLKGKKVAESYLWLEIPIVIVTLPIQLIFSISTKRGRKL
jgi:AhpD family alkylhydroperoxidase